MGALGQARNRRRPGKMMWSAIIAECKPSRSPSRARAKMPSRVQPAVSPKALTRISRDIRSWALHHRSDKSLTELAQMYNPCIRGWITYYSHFYKTQLRPTLKRIDAYVIR